jgi:hypothetical protein
MGWNIGKNVEVTGGKHSVNDAYTFLFGDLGDNGAYP